MPTADTSQTTRTKILRGKELSTYHRLNPYLPQGGRYAFSQTDVIYETVGGKFGGCCQSTSAAPAAAPAPAPAPPPSSTVKDCGSFTGAITIPSIYFSGSRSVTRNTTNNTLTIVIPTSYSNNGAPYGTGNGPIDDDHTGNLISSNATAIISQVGGVYQMDITYTTTYTGGIYTETETLILGSTYWPTSQTVSTVTYGSSNFIAAFDFDPDGTDITVSGGCFGGASYVGGTETTTQNSVVAFYINFSNGTSTRVALGSQFRWTGTANTYTYEFNYTRAELATGTTPSPITGPFTPTSSTGVNTPNV